LAIIVYSTVEVNNLEEVRLGFSAAGCAVLPLVL